MTHVVRYSRPSSLKKGGRTALSEADQHHATRVVRAAAGPAWA